MSATAARSCPTCGNPIPADAPAGLCAICMLTLEEEPETVLLQPDLPRVPGYQLLALLGEGAFARVFHAQSVTDSSTGVAVKVLKDQPTRKAEGHARFRSEIAALKRLRHPNIAQILDWGQTTDGHPFLVMELIEGLPLDRFIRREKPPLAERLQLFLTLCDAVRHAHQSGILHRDLKPENIMVSRAPGGDPVLKLIDLGIAKAMEEPLTTAAATTRMRMVIGTPGYMSPEQCAPGGRVDVRSDVYSLGVVLQLVLTGRQPQGTLARETTASQTGAAFHSAEPAPRPPQDLAWIIARATKDDVGERYQSVDALAADIQRFTEGRPVEARPPSSIYQLSRWADRHKGAAILAALLAVIVPSAAVVSTLLYQRSETSRKKLSRALAQADFLVGAEAQAAGEHRRAIAHFAAAVRSDPSHQAAVGQLLHTLALDPILRFAAHPVRLTGLTEAPAHMAVSSSGACIAITDGRHTLLLDSLQDSSPEKIPAPGDSRITALAVSDAHLAFALADGSLYLQPHAGTPVTLPPIAGGSPWMLQFSRDGQRLLAVSGITVAVIDIASQENLWSHERPVPIRQIVATPDLSHLVMVRERARIRALHHVRIRPSIHESEIPLRPPAASLAISDDGQFVGVGSLTEILVGQILPGSDPVLRTIDIQNPCTSLTFSRDTRLLIAATKDGNVRAWTVDAQSPVASHTQHLAGTKSVTYLDDSRQVLSISRDNHVRIWDIESGQGDQLAVSLEDAWVQFQPAGRILTAFDPAGGGLKRYTLGRNTLPLQIIPDTGWPALPHLTEEEMRGIRLSRNITFASQLPSGIAVVALPTGRLRLWSPAHNPMSPQLPLPGVLTGVGLEGGGDEETLLLRFVDGTVGRLRLPPPAPAPGWLPSFAELTARARLRPDRAYTNPKGLPVTPTGHDPFAKFVREMCPGVKSDAE